MIRIESVLSRLWPWLQVARPSNFFFCAVPVMVGSALALRVGHYAAPRLIGLIGIGITISVAVRYLNDPPDSRRGIDRPGLLKSYHALSQGLNLRAVEVVGLAFLAVALVLCIWLSLAVDWRLLLLTALIGLGVVTYSGGPWPYSSHALGEVAQFIWFGPVAVVCVMYVLSNTVDATAWAAGVALGLLETPFQVANNTRDMETDRIAGKITLPQLLGRRRADVLLTAMVLGAYALLPPLAFIAHSPYVLLPALSLPLAVGVIRRFIRTTSAGEFPRFFPQLGRLNLAYGALLAVGLWLPTLSR